jgi:hypothetical protein
LVTGINMNRARRRIPLGTSAARRLQQLSARTSRQRQGQFRAELEERRQFEDLGLDHEAVQRARAAAYLEAMAGVMEERREPYQLEIPGIKATLMSLRSREPMTDDEARAMGIVLPIEPVARGPAVDQMELNFDAPMAANQISPLTRQVTEESVPGPIDQLPRLREQNQASSNMSRPRRMAADDSVRDAIAAILALSAGIPAAGAALDVATGDPTSTNSGEIPMNAGLALMGLGGAVLGGDVAARISPHGETRLARELLPIAIRRELLALEARHKKIDAPSDIQKLANTRRALDRMEQGVEQRMQAQVDERRSQGHDRPGILYPPGSEGLRKFRRNGVNGLIAGAGLGGALGSLYALSAMEDRP